jgi:glycosyltransferase involved in cell wall biosynthesis
LGGCVRYHYFPFNCDWIGAMKTTIITPTIGTDFLREAVQSVRNQTVPCNHLIVVDGGRYFDKVVRDIDLAPNQRFLVLPENVGAGGWYGHRIYASVPMLVNTPFVSFLDEDNYLEPEFVEIMEQTIQRPNVDVVTCRRNVVNQNRQRIGRDNFESIGANQMGYALHDTNTYLFRQAISHKICPHIYGQWGADRPFTEAVLSHGKHTHLSNYYGVNYRSPVNLYDHFLTNCTK